jgi:hypothetical protein
MQFLRFFLPPILACTTLAAAQQDAQTDAQRDRFNGPVRTVLLQQQREKTDPASGLVWVIQIQPTGDTGFTEYDQEGYRIRSGQQDPDGSFQGYAIQLTRDGTGRVIESAWSSLPGGQVFRHEVLGPFGMIEAQTLSYDQITAVETNAYDQFGNVTEHNFTDASGVPVSRWQSRYNEKGAWVERTFYDKAVRRSYETYDPGTDLQRFEAFDNSGALSVAFTYRHERFESYWSASDGDTFGSVTVDKLDNGDVKSWHCHKSGACVGLTRHSVFTDSTKRYPAMMETRGDDGKLRYRAYYSYEFDEHQNWTSRTISIQSGETEGRTLYETDTRSITYWPE